MLIVCSWKKKNNLVMHYTTPHVHLRTNAYVLPHSMWVASLLLYCHSEVAYWNVGANFVESQKAILDNGRIPTQSLISQTPKRKDCRLCHLLVAKKKLRSFTSEDVEGDVRTFVRTQDNVTNKGSSSSRSGGTNASMSVDPMLKNSRLMSRSAHIGIAD
jgi:hypothetical protein